MDQALPANANVEAAIAEAQANYTARNPESGRLYNDTLDAMPGGNTRTVLYYPPYPLALARGEGCLLWDVDGHEYVDFLGEYTAGLYGHSEPRILAAVKAALDDGIVLGGHNTIEGRFAAQVTARFPSFDRVRFTNSGTEANLMAIGAARAFTGRGKVMVMEGGYHGGVLYFASAAGAKVNVTFDYVMGRFNEIEATRELIRGHASELACILLEPMLGAGGCIPADLDFLRMLREEATGAGAVLIFDEVQTSRLGPSGLQGLFDVHPDLTTLGKYIGGGMSFGAFGGTAKIMDQFDPRRPDAIPHAGTFNNNVLTMSAGLTGLRDIYTPDAAIALNKDGDALRQRLNDLAASQGAALHFSGIGSLMAVQFSTEPVRTLGDVMTQDRTLGDLFHLDLLEQGIYASRRGNLNLSLPMGEAEFDRVADAVENFTASRRSLLAPT